MEQLNRVVDFIKNNKDEAKGMAKGSIVIAASVIAGNSIDPISENREQIADTVVSTSAIMVTYTLMRYTIEHAFEHHRYIGWAGFLGVAAYVADHIYNTWS